MWIIKLVSIQIPVWTHANKLGNFPLRRCVNVQLQGTECPGCKRPAQRQPNEGACPSRPRPGLKHIWGHLYSPVFDLSHTVRWNLTTKLFLCSGHKYNFSSMWYFCTSFDLCAKPFPHSGHKSKTLDTKLFYTLDKKWVVWIRSLPNALWSLSHTQNLSGHSCDPPF